MKENKSAIAVLPGGVTYDGSLTIHSRLRMDLAIRQWRKNHFDFFIVGGKHSPVCAVKKGITEGSCLRRYAIRKNVPKDRILFEERSEDTVLNIIELARIIKAHNIASCTIVSSTNHMKRVMFIARQIMKDKKIDFKNADDGHEKIFSRVFKEWMIRSYTKYWFYTHRHTTLEGLRRNYLNSSFIYAKGARGRMVRFLGRTVFYPILP